MFSRQNQFMAVVIMILMSIINGCGSGTTADAGTTQGGAQAKGQAEGQPGSAAVKAGPAIEPGVAGSFYPAGATKLRSDVTAYIDAAGSAQEQNAWAFIAPHAGYVYSGPIAGFAYRQIQRMSPSRVVVIAFSHRPWDSNGRLRNNGIATTTAASFNTPLGSLAVDVDEAAALIAESKVITDDRALFAGEHSLEVQLPFIQVAAPRSRIVPLMFGNQDDAAVTNELAGILARRYAADPDTVVVVSTDMSHYLSYADAVEIDRLMLKRVLDLDVTGVGPCAEARHGGFCGWGLVAALISAQKALNWPRPVVLDYRNSGDTAGDRRKVVGYGAVAFPRQTAAAVDKGTALDRNPAGTGETMIQTKQARPHDNELTVAQKKELLGIARATVEGLIADGRVPDFKVTDPVLLQPGAAFVTLKIDGDLRGCIGHTEARMPLWQCVREMAVAASTQDPRFNRVRKDELPRLEYEISVLFPPVRVRDTNEIVIGRDGLTIALHGRRGLLLPQVPVEWGWNLQDFLNHTARKAGLPPDAWKDPAAVLHRFEGIIFNEDDVTGKE